MGKNWRNPFGKWVLVAAIAAGAYLLLTKKATAAVAAETPFYNVSATTPQGATITKKISSVQSGVDFINDTSKNNANLNRTSQTLVKPTITATGTAGGIAKLGTGAIVGITTTNKSGVTALDKVIAKNYAASGAENKSFKSAWA